MKTQTAYLTFLLALMTAGAAISQGPIICNDCFPPGNGEIGFPDCSNWPASGILYVDQSITIPGNGRSWPEAMKSLPAALQYANSCDKIKEIRVARGTYKPTTSATTAGRKHTFFLNRGYKLTGGYPSGGGDYNPAENPTILDGDLGGGHKSYHVLVVYGINSLLQPVTIDGFRVRNGAANGYGTLNLGTEVDPVYLSESSGGGAAIMESVNVIFRNCAFYDNGSSETGMGGAFYCNGSSVKVVNCVVARNMSDNYGGGLTMDGLGGVFHAINSTFYGNTGEYGAVYNHLTTLAKFSNCIVWGNSATWGGSGTRAVEYSIIQGGHAGSGNQDLDPQFNNPSDLNGPDDQWFTGDDGLNLKGCSPAINRGYNAAIDGLSLTKDITGADRIHNVTIDAGAYEYQLIPQPGSSTSLAGSEGAFLSSATFVYGGATVIHHECKIMATITPQGASPVSGRMWTSVIYPINNNNLPSFEGIVYAPRYYSIEAATNANAATARVTLYFTQEDFDLYNTAVGPKNLHLPENSTDTKRKSNLLITQFHGRSEALRFDPGTYDGRTEIFHPEDEDIVWHAGRGGSPGNPAQGYWSVTFPVTGFSGFFLSAGTETALPVTLASFEAQPENNTVQLSWKTTSESNSSHFVIQRSNDAREFTEIGRVEAGENPEVARGYSFTDRAPIRHAASPTLYYRLKQVDRDGAHTFSKIVAAHPEKGKVTDRIVMLGNPINDRLLLRYHAAAQEKLTIRLSDISGKLLQSIDTQVIPGEQELSLSMQKLPAGLYLAEVSLPTGERKVFRIVKE